MDPLLHPITITVAVPGNEPVVVKIPWGRDARMEPDFHHRAVIDALREAAADLDFTAPDGAM